MTDYNEDRYEAYLDRGRLFAIDLDTGETFRVILEGRRVFSSLSDDDCPYEIYENDEGVLLCINVDTGYEREAELEKYENN